MVEEALGVALGVGIPLDEFWSSTPYLTTLSVRARAKVAHETAIQVGWWSERFAREERLSSLAHYLRPPEPLTEAAMADAEMTRWALGAGLEVVDIEESEGDG